MSILDQGVVYETEASKNARGGTELMRDRLIKYVDPSLLSKSVIYFSRVDKIHSPNLPQIYYAHDLPEDSSLISVRGFFDVVDHFVFVSEYQKNRYMSHFNLEGRNVHVIPNAIEAFGPRESSKSKTTRLIYHTTPHRGLNLAVPIAEKLIENGYDIHFDVYSSFSVYGWKGADDRFKNLFRRIQSNPNMTYHGSVSNEVVRSALLESDVFLYPSTWEETSCLALIEASQAGLISIIPKCGVFTETVEGKFKFFEPSREVNKHATNAYIAIKSVLDGGTVEERQITSRHSIERYVQEWSNLLSNADKGSADDRRNKC